VIYQKSRIQTHFLFGQQYLKTISNKSDRNTHINKKVVSFDHLIIFLPAIWPVCQSICQYVSLSVRFLNLPVHLPVRQSLGFSVYMPGRQSLGFSVCQSICQDVSLSVSQSASPSARTSVSRFLSLPVHLPGRQSFGFSVCQSICQDASLSVSQSASLSVYSVLQLSVFNFISLSVCQFLGIYLDPLLTFQFYIGKTANKLSTALFFLKKSIYYSLFHSV
jgi:hypothetical protein